MAKWHSLTVLLLAAWTYAQPKGSIDYYGNGDLETPLELGLEDDGRVAKTSQPLECLQVAHPVLTESGLVRDSELVEELTHYNSFAFRLMNHTFGNSYGHPYVGPYKPPPRPFPRAYLNMTVKSQGHQFDRLATMWLGDVEIFRTSTAEPIESPGIEWHYTKDVTAFMSLLMQNSTLIFDLGNLVNEKYTGKFQVDLTIHFHENEVIGPHPGPAHFIVPISAGKGHKGESSAFRFPADKAMTNIGLPGDTSRAILTIAATGQAEEEFWWSNLPESLTDYFNYSDNRLLPGGSSFREIQVRIDGKIAGLAWPFPVVFTGGIAPPLHRPMVGLQTFDLREYEVDITPWLGVLCDGNEHSVALEVIAIDDTKNGNGTAIPAKNDWVLSGKIFGWREGGQGKRAVGKVPQTRISDINYQLSVGKPNASELLYNQTINRSFEVRSKMWLPSEGYITATWSQEYYMFNNGSMKHSGLWHDVDGWYYGYGISKYDAGHGLATAFRYPVSTTYWYKTPDPETNATLSVLARLKQEMEITVLGVTPFATGIEPFLDRLGDEVVTGTHLKAVRESQAQFCQDTNLSYGHGEMKQTYELRAVDMYSYEKPWAPGKVKLLYKREIGFENETKTHDQELVYYRRVQPSEASHNLARNSTLAGWDEFAPLHSKSLGVSQLCTNGCQSQSEDEDAKTVDLLLEDKTVELQNTFGQDQE